jgi:hypothetical protein
MVNCAGEVPAFAVRRRALGGGVFETLLGAELIAGMSMRHLTGLEMIMKARP